MALASKMQTLSSPNETFLVKRNKASQHLYFFSNPVPPVRVTSLLGQPRPFHQLLVLLSGFISGVQSSTHCFDLGMATEQSMDIVSVHLGPNLLLLWGPE